MTNSFVQRLQKWLDGSYKLFDEKAMHKMMREDDFVRESFEGYMGVPEEAHEERLQRLRGKINAPDNPLGTKKRDSGRTQWFVAASLALVVGALWFFMRRNHPVADQTMATTNESLPTKEEPASVALEDKAGASDMASAPLPSKATQDDAIAFKKNGDIDTENVSTASTSKAEEDNNAKIAQNGAADVGAEKLDKTRNNDVATETARESVTIATDEQVFSDKTITSTASAPIVAQTEASKARVDAEKEVALHEVAAKKETMPKSKAKASAKPSAPKKNEGVFHNTDRKITESAEGDKLPARPEPLGGMEAYRDYLLTAVRKPAAALQNNVHGKVILRFSVSKDGRPIQIVTTKSLGYGCNEEAIRLVLEGDSWGQGQENLVELEVEF